MRADRRKYAKLVGNVSDDDYPIFESAITGRASLGDDSKGSFLELGEQTSEEQHRIRQSFIEKEGLLEQVFALLRNAPRRVLMILKLNDLTRSLDAALQTTHPPFRVWLIVAHYCVLAVWRDDADRLRRAHAGLLDWLRVSARFAGWEVSLAVAAFVSDRVAIVNRWRRQLAGEWRV